MKALISENIGILQQGIELLSRLTDAQYTQKLPACFNASIGGHLRHTIDHYLSFIGGIHSGGLDYEARARDVRIETHRTYAIDVLAGIVDQLNYLPKLDRTLRIRMENTQLQEPNAWGVSSGRRELQFLLSHTVHHYALIAISCRLQGVEPQADFGMAPSTLRYRDAKNIKVA